MAARERRLRERFPRVGGLLLKVVAPPHTTTAWAIGAAGEREVAEKLQREVGDTVLFLFNRKRGTGRVGGDIDILAIASSGVWIIDPKKYVGKKVRANWRRTTFIINGRRHPKLSESMRKQIEVVTAGVLEGPVPTARVHAAYCFVGADLPWRRLVVDGISALSQRGVVKALRQPGPLDADERELLQADLAKRFPSA